MTYTHVLQYLFKGLELKSICHLDPVIICDTTQIQLLLDSWGKFLSALSA